MDHGPGWERPLWTTVLAENLKPHPPLPQQRSLFLGGSHRLLASCVPNPPAVVATTKHGPSQASQILSHGILELEIGYSGQLLLGSLPKKIHFPAWDTEWKPGKREEFGKLGPHSREKQLKKVVPHEEDCKKHSPRY